LNECKSLGGGGGGDRGFGAAGLAAGLHSVSLTLLEKEDERVAAVRLERQSAALRAREDMEEEDDEEEEEEEMEEEEETGQDKDGAHQAGAPASTAGAERAGLAGTAGLPPESRAGGNPGDVPTPLRDGGGVVVAAAARAPGRSVGRGPVKGSGRATADELRRAMLEGWGGGLPMKDGEGNGGGGGIHSGGEGGGEGGRETNGGGGGGGGGGGAESRAGAYTRPVFSST